MKAGCQILSVQVTTNQHGHFHQGLPLEERGLAELLLPLQSVFALELSSGPSRLPGLVGVQDREAVAEVPVSPEQFVLVIVVGILLPF